MRPDVDRRLLVIPVASGLIALAALATGNPLVAGIALVVGLAALGIVAIGRNRRGRALAADEDRIRHDGILGRAIVVAATSTGERRGEREEVELALDVQLPMRRRFQIRRTDWLDARERAMVVVGRPIVVAGDQSEPGHIVPVFDIPNIDQEAIDGLGPIAGGPGGPKRDPAVRSSGSGPGRDR